MTFDTNDPGENSVQQGDLDTPLSDLGAVYGDPVDSGGATLTDTTRDFLEVESTDLRLGTGQAIEDGSGTERLALGTNTVLTADDGTQELAARNDDTALGRQAGNGQVAETALGFRAGRNNTGNFSTMTGQNAGRNNTGNFSIMTGQSAGRNNTGDRAIMTGRDAGRNNIGDSSTMTGQSAGRNNTGDRAIMTGRDAGLNNIGDSSTMTGQNAGRNNIGNFSTITGRNAGLNNTGDRAIMTGLDAGRGDGLADPTTMGDDNIGIGVSAIRDNQASGLIAIGQEAGRNATTDDLLIVTDRNGNRRLEMDLTNGNLSIEGSLTQNASL